MGISIAVTVSIWIFVGNLLIWGWRLLNWVWLRPKKFEKCLRERGFTGNSYRILYGDLKERSAMMKQANSKPMNFSHDIAPRVMPSLYRTVKNYGKKSFMWIGPYPRINILDPEQLKTVLSLNNNEVRKFVPNPLVENFLFSGLGIHEGAKWAQHRKIINPAFHFEKLKGMVPAFLHCCSDMIIKWEKLVYEKGSCELDVMPYLQNLSADVISRAAFGSSFEEGKKIFQLLKELENLVISASSIAYIPAWRFLPTRLNNRCRAINKEIKALLLGIINKRQKAMDGSGEEATNNDLLGILMESNFNEIRKHGNNKNNGLSKEDVIEESRIFYLAGQETTSIFLVWTMILLSSHPIWQERARAEVLKVFGNNNPDFDGLTRLKIVTMILNEVLRLYSGGILSRKFEKETQLGKWTIPAGVVVCFPVVLIHHDREIWGDDADEFKPERFSEGVSKATKNQFAFFPFGWGPRVCIGQNFTMIEAKMAISMILQKFSFVLSSSYTHAPATMMVVEPQYGAQIILHKL